MKQFVTALVLCFISIFLNAQGNIDVLHYKFEFNLNDETDIITGKASVTLLFRNEADNCGLDLNSAAKGKGMSVFSVTDNKDDNKLLPIVHFADKLKITFPKKINAGDTVTIIIRYKGIPADGLIISKNKYGKRTFFSDNWPNRAHYWIPCVDDPADKATVEFIVTAPSHYQVISNGVQIEETNLPDNKKLTHYKEDVPLPTKVMVIGVADFAVTRVGDINCLPVYSWVYPENKQEGFDDYAAAKDILAWHINYIGPYPYKKLANVQSKTRFGGMENAGAIFYAEDKVTGLGQQEELLSHEIVHQWFGDMATEKSFAHLWLSEGFATYLTHLYIESKYGTDSLNTEMAIDRDAVIDFVKTSHRPVVDSDSDYMNLLNNNSYQKGSWVLHMLRRELGDSVFKNCVRQYYAAYAGKNADTKDLQKVFESVSGKDLGLFFKQWLYSTENPLLEISWKYDVKKKQILVNVNQKQITEFRFHFEVAFTTTKGKTIIEKFIIDRKMKSFAISMAEKPATVLTDPNVSLLFEGKVTELK